MASSRPQGAKRLNETTWAIIGAGVVAIVLSTLMVGSPFRALRLAYLDYSRTPAAGAPEASTTRAPVTSPNDTQSARQGAAPAK